MGGIDGVHGKKVRCTKEREDGIKLEREERERGKGVRERASMYVP